MPDGSWETPEAFFRRTKLAAQQRAWRNANYVFVARVRSHRQVSETRVDATIDPIGVLKGKEGDTKRYGSFDPGLLDTCGPEYLYPEVGEYGVFYAQRTKGWRRWLPWSRMTITYAVPIHMLFDPRVPVEMRAAADRIRSKRHQ